MVGEQWAGGQESLILSPGIDHKVVGARGQVVSCKEALCRQGSFLLPVVSLTLAGPRREPQAGGRQCGAVTISLRFRISEQKFESQTSASLNLTFLICKMGMTVTTFRFPMSNDRDAVH